MVSFLPRWLRRRNASLGAARRAVRSMPAKKRTTRRWSFEQLEDRIVLSSNTLVQGWENIAGAWGGTLQGGNSNYSESAWVPYRFVDTSGEAAGSTHTLVLQYDFADSQG